MLSQLTRFSLGGFPWFHAMGSARSQTSKILQAQTQTTHFEAASDIKWSGNFWVTFAGMFQHVSTCFNIFSSQQFGRKHSTMAAIDAGDLEEESKAMNAGVCPSMGYRGLPPKCLCSKVNLGFWWILEGPFLSASADKHVKQCKDFKVLLFWVPCCPAL